MCSFFYMQLKVLHDKYTLSSAYAALVKSPQGSFPSTPKLASVVVGLVEFVSENELSKSNRVLALFCCELFEVVTECSVVATGAAATTPGC